MEPEKVTHYWPSFVAAIPESGGSLSGAPEIPGNTRKYQGQPLINAAIKCNDLK